ncbi:hypothetical protein D3C84_361170 [compost metagenome]
MCEVGHDDHRPDEGAALSGNKLQIDRKKHVVHAGNHQRRIQQTENRPTDHRRQVKQGHHAFSDQNPQVTGHRTDHGQRQHPGHDDRGNRHHQQLNGIGYPRPQPFFNDAHDVGGQQDRQNLTLVADLLDLEPAKNIEIRQALAVQPGHRLAVVPGVEQVRVNQHQTQHDAKDFTAAKTLGCRPADQRREEHERGVGHQIDQAPDTVQRRVSLKQGLAGNEHAFGADQVVHPHQQAGNDQRRQDRHEHIGEHPHQTLHGIGFIDTLLFHVGDGRRSKPCLLAQRGVNLLDFAGTDDDLKQAAGEERAFDQVDLIQRRAVDPLWVFEGQAQTRDAMCGLFKVVSTTEAMKQLAGDSRVIVAHAFSSTVFFVVWQHAEAKNTRLYELKQQLVQTS